MKLQTLINILNTFINAGKKKQRDQIVSIKIILKKLKKKEFALKQKMYNEKDKKIRRHLQRELKIITTQRKKGLCMVKKVKNRVK
ncbi:MAG: hypothetical protein KZQ83_15235 [gamma proteobacterium symbiont of Taylorina sp.]|nr:hypothetical protein [gamma proteobacterium symbiont of Taylorina sp.]